LEVLLLTLRERRKIFLKEGLSMKRRLGLWALIGLAVAFCWFLISLILPPRYMYPLGHSSILAITAPASLLGRAMPLAYYWFILLNGVAYLFVGLATEWLRPSRTR
jgi:hypothetical protein